MESEQDVEDYLRDFKIKMRVWDVLFRDDRGKNYQALEALGIIPAQRKEVLNELTSSDYSDGPIPDEAFGGSDLWVFGRTINGKEVYIKICMGHENTATICVSFHVAEHPMQYPFKIQ